MGKISLTSPTGINVPTRDLLPAEAKVFSTVGTFERQKKCL